MIAHAIVDAPNKGRSTLPAATSAELEHLGINRELRTDTQRGAVLSSWIVEPSTNTGARATIFVLHGIRDSKRTQVALGKALAEQGYRAVLIDLRGHGDSSGDTLSYGIEESLDLSAVLNAIEHQGLLSGQVGVVAASYGAACALQWAAFEPRVKAIVSVATFTSLREVVPCYLRLAHIHWLISDASLNRALSRAGALAHFEIDDASPLRAIQQTQAAVLLIHGEQDRHIPPDHSRRLHAAAPDRSKLIIVPGENHDTIMRDRAGIIKREMLAWLETHLQ